MKKSLLVMMCVIGISSYAGAAVTINYNTTLDSDGVLTTIYTPTTVYDFSSDPGLPGIMLSSQDRWVVNMPPLIIMR